MLIPPPFLTSYFNHQWILLLSVPAIFLVIRTMMNSAGASGAKPISQITCPCSRPSSGLVSASHLMKKASAGVRPLSAPRCKQFVTIATESISYPLPQRVIIRLKNQVVQIAIDPADESQKKPAHVDVAPISENAQCARTPDPDAASENCANSSRQLRLDRCDFSLRCSAQVHHAFDDFIGGSFVKTDLSIGARVDTRDMAAGRTFSLPHDP